MINEVPHQRQRVELAMDLLKGCPYSCTGCMVEKEVHATTDVISNISKMMDGFAESGYYLFDITIGATDFGSAGNVEEIVNNEELSDLVRKFRILKVTCPMLDKSDEYYKRLAENLLKLSKNQNYISIVIPVGVGHMANITMMENIRRRVAYLQTLLDGKMDEIAFVLNITEELFDKYDFDKIVDTFDMPDIGVFSDMIMNIPHGRRPDIATNPKYGKVIGGLSRKLSEFYEWMDSDVEMQQDSDLDGFTGTQINVHVIDDAVYIVPYLKDEFTIFSDGFKLRAPTFEAAMERVAEIRDPSNRKFLPECEGCPEIAYCTEKGIHKLIEELGMETCPVKHDAQL